ncbi:MAG: gliding motility-associated peptidyl-prolyl isomerase GldI [Salegentibacter sp.]|uniref:Peptidyl-prolyl cis-trans isomerase n=1 Tax=Salegentibacter flavus TaxID=287099 RepID=A0A1I5BVY7_9FLAO|nr:MULTISPECIES: gliding motility-associated peptidyl-prolyl isomerase GldI [Salegentibacter]MDR9457831.1 gliding motility-associated peptidyl-prolyl isomerase GldI [Salegentibacter sp.]SFN78815.1 peptidyl-prolyl isomerase, gliding motility-associated [Salegentibacter flavus]
MRIALILLTILMLGACKSPEARYPVSQNSGSYIRESVERNRELVAAEEEYIKDLMEEDSATEYLVSNDGFWYYYNKRSTDSSNTEMPEFGDLVKFDYSLSTLDGEPIYEEGEKPTREYAVDQEELFSGLRQGLKLMKEGETVTFLFPSHKAYGYYGDKNKIGTNVPVKAKVTLHDINKNESKNED